MLIFSCKYTKFAGITMEVKIRRRLVLFLELEFLPMVTSRAIFSPLFFFGLSPQTCIWTFFLFLFLFFSKIVWLYKKTKKVIQFFIVKISMTMDFMSLRLKLSSEIRKTCREFNLKNSTDSRRQVCYFLSELLSL